MRLQETALLLLCIGLGFGKGEAAPSDELVLQMRAFPSLDAAWKAYLFTNHTYFHAILDILEADAIFMETNRTWFVPTDNAWRDYLHEQNVTDDDQNPKELFESHSDRLKQVLGYHCSDQVYSSLGQLLNASKIQMVIRQSIAVKKGNGTVVLQGFGNSAPVLPDQIHGVIRRGNLTVGSFFTINHVLLPDASQPVPAVLGLGLEALQVAVASAPPPLPAANSTTSGTAAVPPSSASANGGGGNGGSLAPRAASNSTNSSGNRPVRAVRVTMSALSALVAVLLLLLLA